MHHLMWILTWIAVGIGGALGAASVIMLSESHQSGTQHPDCDCPLGRTARPCPPSGRPASRRAACIVTSHRHSRLAADERAAEARLTE